MSRKDKMSEEAECVEAIFLSYIQTKSSQKIFLFFEGIDGLHLWEFHTII